MDVPLVTAMYIGGSLIGTNSHWVCVFLKKCSKWNFNFLKLVKSIVFSCFK